MKRGLLTHIFIAFAFLANATGPLCPIVYSAEGEDFRLPAPGVMVHLSPPLEPPILKGIKVHTDNPFRIDFILDRGDSRLGNEQLKDLSRKLIKYFLASLTIPEKDLWVNLSPYEKDRITTQSFGLTEMGRDLLAEDYILKQITASLIYPEDQLGKKFWKRVYQEAAKKFATTDIPVNTFNKVWIVPEKAVVYENGQAATAYVVESKLKVMLEQDYLSLDKHAGVQSDLPKTRETSQLGSQMVREIIIPELTKEVNEDKNFGKLRQIYNSLILAVWYKKKIRGSILAQAYEDKNKVAGVNINDPREKEKIYQQYLEAFKRGVYNYIKEDIDPATQETIPRKYFSGGVDFAMSAFKGIDNLIAITPSLPNQSISSLSVVDAVIAMKAGTVPQSPPTAANKELISTDRAMIMEHINRRLKDAYMERQIAVLSFNPEIYGEREAIINALGILKKPYYEVTKGNLTSIVSRRDGMWTPVIVAPENVEFTSDEQGAEFLKLVHLDLMHEGPFATIGDVSKRQGDYLAEISRQNRDDLTGLLNVTGFKHRTQQYIEEMRSRGEKVHIKLAVFDLDNLKSIITLWNWAKANATVVATARALEASIRPEDIPSHLHSGDEFGILIPVTKGMGDYPEKVRRAIREKMYHSLGTSREEVLNKLNSMGRKKDPVLLGGLLTQLALQNPGLKKAQINEKLKNKTMSQIAAILAREDSPYKFNGWFVTFSMGVVDYDENKGAASLEPTQSKQLVDSLFDQAGDLAKRIKSNGKDGILRGNGTYKDHAMIAPEKSVSVASISNGLQKNGGIDLTPANMNFQMKNNGGLIKFDIDPAVLQSAQDAAGFTPIIINIHPVTDLRLFLAEKKLAAT